MSEEPHGARGSVKIERPGMMEDIDVDVSSGSPVRVEIKGESFKGGNILAEDAEIALTVRDNELTLNVNLEGDEFVSFDEWQEGKLSQENES